MELQKRITELEQEIINLKAAFADEKEKMMQEQNKVVSGFEQKIESLKKDHSNVLSTVRSEQAEKEKNIKIEHENELAELRKSLGAATSDEINKLKEKHAEEIR